MVSMLISVYSSLAPSLSQPFSAEDAPSSPGLQPVGGQYKKKKGISDLNGFKSRPDVAPFVLPTFEDVLPEVKHALLDRVSLLRNLHVFINLTEEKRSLDRSTGFKACGKGRKCPTSCLEFILKDYERMELRGRVYL